MQTVGKGALRVHSEGVHYNVIVTVSKCEAKNTIKS